MEQKQLKSFKDLIVWQKAVDLATSIFFLLFLYSIFYLLNPLITEAATLEVVLNPQSQVNFLLDTENQSINAVEAHLEFNSGEFQIQDVSDGGSIVSMWIQKPVFSNAAGTLDFSGIVPGGYDGANGKIIAVSIVPQKTGALGGFQVVSSNILLNDGKGTPTKLEVKNLAFNIQDLGEKSLNSKSSILAPQKDTQPPDPFIPEIGRDPNIFNGEYFLVFAATDQLSGIDHYEVCEDSGFREIIKKFLYSIILNPANKSSILNSCLTAESPHLLSDQSLSSDIFVRAVDKAGNSRTVEIPARFPSPIPARLKLLFFVIFGLIMIVLLGVFSFRWKREKRI